uniref:Uncharacterized protein n=1 Tax=Oryza barthii TaxID=65489 RepID=A0A0D3FKP2_9ORYZ
MARRVCVVLRIQPNGSSDAYIPHASATSEWQEGFAWFVESSQMVPPMRTEDGSSQFLPGHATFSDSVPQVNMPMFPTGMNDQWHRASTYNTGMYSAIQMMGYAGNTQSYGEPCSYGGGSSIAQHEIGPPQIDEPPPIT